MNSYDHFFYIEKMLELGVKEASGVIDCAIK